MASVLRGSGDSSFGGNLSIEGVLTYEDVASVDSIGIITARSGVDSIGIITARSGIDIGTGTSISSPSSNTLTLGTNNEERLRITSGGNIGIGTVSPRGKLEVSDGTSNTAGEAINEAYIVGATTGSSEGILTIQSNDAMASDKGGSIAFGGRAITSSTAGANWAFINGYKENGTTANYGGYLSFATRPNSGSISEAMRIDSSGRLLVGTLTNFDADANLQAQGEGIAIKRDTNSSGVNNGLIRFYSGSGLTAQLFGLNDGAQASGDTPGALVFSTNGGSPATSPTERMRIQQNGIIRSAATYANTSASAANMIVFGSGDLGRSTSSIKYKTDVETLEDQYADNILNCRPVWYRSTCEADNPNFGWWGFIAEEVAAIDPRLVHWRTTEVTHDEEGAAVETPCDPEPEGVAYDRFVPHLLNLIKRQGEAIAELQAEVAALKAL